MIGLKAIWWKVLELSKYVRLAILCTLTVRK
jgi:hypothetical protein